MNNKQIAKILSAHCMKPNNNDKDYAVQLFVEKIVLPNGTLNYSAESIESLILEYLKGK